MSAWKNKFARGSKYGAQPVTLPTGEAFPSKLEAAVYGLLKLRERAGEIIDIKRQASVALGFGLRWKVDFTFQDAKTGRQVWAEAKGAWDRQARRNLKMWEGGAGPGPLEVWQGDYRKPVLVRVVTPAQTPQDARHCPGCRCDDLPDINSANGKQ